MHISANRIAKLFAPLLAQLAAANLVVTVALLASWPMVSQWSREAAALLLLALATLHFVWLLAVLRPVQKLEQLAATWYALTAPAHITPGTPVPIIAALSSVLEGSAAEGLRMRDLTVAFLSIEERERATLAEVLDNSTAQQLAALLLELSAATRQAASNPLLEEKLQRARDSAEDILEAVRRLAHHLYPSVLEKLGLDAALRKLARDWSRGTGIDVDVDTARAPANLRLEVSVLLYRVAEEGVRNATQHAKPRRVQISVFGSADVTLEVHDDGRGFNPIADNSQTRNGLRVLRERVALAGGAVDIKTALGGGTTISAVLPAESRVETHVPANHDQ